MARTELHAQDAADQPTGEAHGNVTGYTSATRRGTHAVDLPITSIKTITPASNTDVNFTHRFLYSGDGGTVVIRFASGGTAYSLVIPAGALLPIVVYSVDSFSGSDIHLFG